MALKSLFRYTSVTQQCLRSYDDYTVNKVPQIVNSTIRVRSQLDNSEREHVIKISDARWGEPCVVERDGETRTLTSTEARLRDLTYSAPLYAKIDYEIIDDGSVKSTKVYKDVFIARIPVMVNSSLDTTRDHPSHNECAHDPGGFFLINGREKVCVIQESIRPNTLMCFGSKSKGIASVIYPQLDRLTLRNATIRAYIKSQDIFMDFNGQFNDGVVVMKKVPLRLLLLVVGESRASLETYVTTCVADPLKQERLLAAIDPCFDNDDQKIWTLGWGSDPAHTIQRAWRYYVSTRPRLRARLEMYSYNKKWEKIIYPHDPKNSGKLLLEQIKLLLFVELKFREPDSRDAEKNKRLLAAGTLMMSLTANLWNIFISQTTRTIQKYVNSGKQLRLNKLCSSTFLTDGIKYSLATGRWAAKNEAGGRSGVAQTLNRQTFISCISQLRRIDSSVPTDTKIVEPRLLRGDSFGFRCPSETPEGSPCGLVTQLSVAARISVESDPRFVFKKVKRFIKKDGKYPVFFNGCYYGKANNIKNMAKRIRYLRRCRTIPLDVSVCTQDEKLEVFTDFGRIIRPVYVVRGLDDVGTTPEIERELEAGRMTWDDLLNAGIVEYIDSLETQDCLIALTEAEVTKHHSHCEIHTSLILGVMASTIPYPECNQSPRITYQAAMGKQATGVYALNYAQRFDTMANILHYVQKPLVTTRINEEIAGELPSGHNAIVAVLIYGGYNQEDSVLLNQASVDRGFGRLTNYRTYSASDIARGQRKHIFGQGEEKSDTIEDDGLPIPNTEIKKGAVLIGRQCGERDASIVNKKNEGVIDDIIICQNDQGGVTIKTKVRQTRSVELGDKWSSRHGQKGTVGQLVPQEDMPFCLDGTVPDLILSPHALPSRMTVAHCIEALASKVAALSGNRQFASAFDHDDVYEYAAQLKALGYQPHGNQIMFDGRTGKQLQAAVFIGPTFYQRLKHMVCDKIHSRRLGKVVGMTRQPAEGRSRGGGLRFGEMVSWQKKIIKSINAKHSNKRLTFKPHRKRM